MPPCNCPERRLRRCGRPARSLFFRGSLGLDLTEQYLSVSPLFVRGSTLPRPTTLGRGWDPLADHVWCDGAKVEMWLIVDCCRDGPEIEPTPSVRSTCSPRDASYTIPTHNQPHGHCVRRAWFRWVSARHAARLEYGLITIKILQRNNRRPVGCRSERLRTAECRLRRRTTRT